MKFITLAYFIFVNVLLFMPARDIQPPFTHADKITHFVLFLVLTILARLSLKTLRYEVLLTSLISYAIITEVIQGLFIPTRNFDFFDIIANTTGIIIGLTLIQWFTQRKSASKKQL